MILSVFRYIKIIFWKSDVRNLKEVGSCKGKNQSEIAPITSIVEI